jgi:hypothetical protein
VVALHGRALKNEGLKITPIPGNTAHWRMGFRACDVVLLRAGCPGWSTAATAAGGTRKLQPGDARHGGRDDEKQLRVHMATPARELSPIRLIVS